MGFFSINKGIKWKASCILPGHHICHICTSLKLLTFIWEGFWLPFIPESQTDFPSRGRGSVSERKRTKIRLRASPLLRLQLTGALWQLIHSSSWPLLYLESATGACLSTERAKVSPFTLTFTPIGAIYSLQIDLNKICMFWDCGSKQEKIYKTNPGFLLWKQQCETPIHHTTAIFKKIIQCV